MTSLSSPLPPSSSSSLHMKLLKSSSTPLPSMLLPPERCSTSLTSAYENKMASLNRRRKDMKIRRLQASIYDFLERPKDYKSVGYQLIVFLMVFLCLLLSVFSTVEQYEHVATESLYVFELIMVVWFIIEFSFRVWSAGCRSRYQNLSGRFLFIRRPLCVLDIIVTSASIIILCLRTNGKMFATSALRGFRCFQILRMLRMDRRGGSWKLLGSVIWAHRQELFTTLYIGFLGLISFSFLIYLAEKDRNPNKFGTYLDALWWGVVTLCTVGYGDAVPVTWLGKLIASCCALLGISFFALPAGIMGSGFALKVQQQQRQKHLTRRKGPAAVLIQSLWRCHAAEKTSNFRATWMIHVTKLSPKTTGTSNSTSASQRFKMNSGFISRLSIRRKEGYHHSNYNNSSNNSNNNSVINLNNSNNDSENNTSNKLDLTSPTSSSKLTTSPFRASRKLQPRLQQQKQQQPQQQHSLIRKTYSSTVDSSSGRHPPISRSTKLKRSHISFHDVVVLEGARLNDVITAEGSSNDRQSSNFVAATVATTTTATTAADDDSLNERVVHLTSTHKAAIRAIRKIKFFVARRIFKEALKPYDVKDVIEQYSAGHLDMLTRIKDLQLRLDLIVGHSGNSINDVSESRVSMASRFIKVEKKIDAIDAKLDALIDLYRESKNVASSTNNNDNINNIISNSNKNGNVNKSNAAAPTCQSFLTANTFGEEKCVEDCCRVHSKHSSIRRAHHYSIKTTPSKHFHGMACKQLSEPISGDNQFLSVIGQLPQAHSDNLPDYCPSETGTSVDTDKSKWDDSSMPLLNFNVSDSNDSIISSNKVDTNHISKNYYELQQTANDYGVEHVRYRNLSNPVTENIISRKTNGIYTISNKENQEFNLKKQNSEKSQVTSKQIDAIVTIENDNLPILKGFSDYKNDEKCLSNSYDLLSTDANELDPLIPEISLIDSSSNSPNKTIENTYACLDSENQFSTSKYQRLLNTRTNPIIEVSKTLTNPIPLLDPLVNRQDQYPSIFLTMPSNEMISPVDNISVRDHDDNSFEIPRSISSICSFQEF